MEATDEWHQNIKTAPGGHQHCHKAEPQCTWVRKVTPKSLTPNVGRLCMVPLRQKADSTLRSSRAVPHPSTDRALRRLTSEVRRDPVHSTRYGRQREIGALRHLVGVVGSSKSPKQ
jgi:hypothetical protein